MADPPLAEFVAAVSIAESESAAAVAGVDRAAEALDAVVAAIVCHGEIIAAIGYRDATAPSDELFDQRPLLPPLRGAIGMAAGATIGCTGGSAEGLPTPDRSRSSSACARDANEPDGRAAAALQVSLSSAPAASPGSSPGASRRSSDPSSYRGEPFEPSRQKRIGR